MQIQAVLVAGDKGASRAIGGTSKTFAELAGKPMFVHVLETLLQTPEVNEVYVVGDASRLELAIAQHRCVELGATRGCPVHVVPQRSSLYENVWETFQLALPPGEPDLDHPILVAPADIPLALPAEVSDFVRKSLESGADYALGLSPDVALEGFSPRDGEDGISMTYFNLAEGRYRQNNLTVVRPLRVGNRHYIQDMYENRYQQELTSGLRVAWRIATREFHSLWVLFFFLLLHCAAILDRHGHRRAADLVSSWVSLGTVERGIGAMLRAKLRFVITELGGAAIDIDNEADLAVAQKMIDRWKEMQTRIATAA
ncbi:MAG: NTP transferase domain-containing protein [Myxococcota bacterium]